MIIVLSQEEGYNAAQANLLKSDILKQAGIEDKVIWKKNKLNYQVL